MHSEILLQGRLADRLYNGLHILLCAKPGVFCGALDTKFQPYNGS